ncbi:MAG TPA: 50S ribosomal protein L22 [Bacteroidales bacterium]|jgi:large subunit ribosomal protein L22|nr:50S ribosomal protein L22 [Bacteroidales bacterium]MDD4235473.1 50S ribosomal protein L22 [Bacteroidales bacterium]MDY0160444.1 50S ribosomal protein L22 [Bacteroidales bacterium]HRW20447.1 50S ribosomal protein L22 [Bacteroidales bacterium]HXK81853.1 50S ribosomal protein L22 [Bacteroidales bacterium]
MGARKRNRAERNKQEKQKISFAVLKNCPSSPRKMRLVADIIRGEDVNKALDILKYSSKAAAGDMEKLLMSAIANWQLKNEGVRMEEAELFVKEVSVDGGRVLKRVQPAPQGRAYRIRKRSNHVTIVVEAKNSQAESNIEEVVEAENEN